jgi:hypothetical protein
MQKLLQALVARNSEQNAQKTGKIHTKKQKKYLKFSNLMRIGMSLGLK